MLDLNHSRTVGRIELSAYGSIDVERSRTLANRSYSGGLSLSAEVPLKWSLSVDYNSLDQRDLITPLMQDQGLSVSASADLTPYLQPLRLPSAAYLKFKAFTDWDRSRFGPLPTDQQLAPGAMIMFGTPL